MRQNDPIAMMQGMANNPLFQIINAARSGRPYMPMLQQMAAQNPQAAQAMRIVQGKSPQQLQQIAENMAKERGLSIQDMMNSLGLK